MREFLAILACFPIAFVVLEFVLPRPDWTLRLQQAIVVGHFRRVRRAEFERHRAEFRRHHV